MNFWKELEIASTKNEKAIKHAYAVKLKKIDREKNPEEFQKLRLAYENAISYSENQSIYSDEDNTGYSFDEDSSKEETFDYTTSIVKIIQESIINDSNELTNSSIKIRAHKRVEAFFSFLKEKGEQESIAEWEILKRELSEETIDFAEEINKSFIDKINELYDKFEEKNPTEFPFILFEKIFSYFEWDNALFANYYSISFLQRRLNARRARIEIENNPILSPLLLTQINPNDKKIKSKFSIYRIQKKIEELEKDCPEVFEYELDSETITYLKNLTITNGIWEFLSFLALLALLFFAYQAENKIVKYILYPLSFFLIGRAIREFIDSYLFFYKKIKYTFENEFQENKWYAVGMLGFILFIETIALTSLKEVNLVNSIFVFLRVVVGILLLSPVIEFITDLLFKFYDRLNSQIIPLKTEIWLIGYFLLFVMTVFIESSSKLEVALLGCILFGFYSLFNRKSQEFFFGEVYLTLLLSPIASYYLISLFQFKEFILISNSVLFMTAFPNLHDFFLEKRIRLPRFLIGTMTGIGIVFCFISVGIPTLESMIKIYLIITLLLGFYSFTTKKNWIIHWMAIVSISMIASIFLKEKLNFNNTFFPILCQLIIIRLWIFVNQIYFKWKGRELLEDG